MKKFLLLTIFILFLFPQISFSKDFDNSVIGMDSTKVRLTYGDPIEQVKYDVLHTYSFLYPTCIIYFKNDIAYKITARPDIEKKAINSDKKNIAKKKMQNQNNKNKKEYNKNLVNDMFTSNKASDKNEE